MTELTLDKIEQLRSQYMSQGNNDSACARLIADEHQLDARKILSRIQQGVRRKRWQRNPRSPQKKLTDAQRRHRKLYREEIIPRELDNLREAGFEGTLDMVVSVIEEKTARDSGMISYAVEHIFKRKKDDNYHDVILTYPEYRKRRDIFIYECDLTLDEEDSAKVSQVLYGWKVFHDGAGNHLTQNTILQLIRKYMPTTHNIASREVAQFRRTKYAELGLEPVMAAGIIAQEEIEIFGSPEEGLKERIYNQLMKSKSRAKKK